MRRFFSRDQQGMTHTIVVGAGIAGLWIANRLAQAGERVTVLEAYGKPGGRVLTSRHGYELGAGRIHASHRRVHTLLRRYRLHTVPLGTSLNWHPVGEPSRPNTFDAEWAAVCGALRRLRPELLATHTLRQLAEAVLGKVRATSLLEQYPYRAEIDRLRADVGLQAFEHEMKSHRGFTIVHEGLSAMIDGLVRDLRAAGGLLRLNTKVVDVEHAGSDRYRVRLERGAPLTADRVILALHATALRSLPVTTNMPALDHLVMAPLIRIYAQYPGGWRYPREVTDSPLRYVIPVDPAKGIVMISYTDDRDTKRWSGLSGEELVAAIQPEVRRLYGRHLPDPEWVRAAEWHEGATYWRPGCYSPARMSRAALQPRGDMPGLFCCGESFSPTQQAWMEGALAHAELLWELLERRGRQH